MCQEAPSIGPWESRWPSHKTERGWEEFGGPLQGPGGIGDPPKRSSEVGRPSHRTGRDWEALLKGW